MHFGPDYDDLAYVPSLSRCRRDSVILVLGIRKSTLHTNSTIAVRRLKEDPRASTRKLTVQSACRP